MKLGHKVITMLASTVFGTLLLTTAFELKQLQHKFDEENNNLHKTILANLMPNLSGALYNFDETRMATQVATAFEFGDIESIHILDESGKIVVSYSKAEQQNEALREEASEALKRLPPGDYKKPITNLEKSSLAMIRSSQEKQGKTHLIAALWHHDGDVKLYIGHVSLSYHNRKAQEALKEATEYRLGSAVVLASSIFLLTFWFMRSSVIRRIERLKRHALRIKERNYESHIAIDGKDEITDLALTFRDMSHEIKTYQNSLEDKVKEKTRDIRSILDNTRVGIFTLDENLIIQKDYAHFLEHILEQDNLSGSRLEELILNSSHLLAEERQRVLTALSYSMGQDELIFNANASNLPKTLELNFGTHKKFLDLDWAPMYNDHGIVDKILVSLRDITENLRLKKDADLAQKNLTRLGEILDVGPEAYLRFKRECQDMMQTISTTLTSKGTSLNQDLIAQIYVLLHTMKGSARFYKFVEAADALHHMEDLVSQRKTKDALNLERLQDELKNIQAVLDRYDSSCNPLLSLKAHNKSSLKDPHQNHDGKLTFLFREMEQFADELAKDLGKGGFSIRKELHGHDMVHPDFYKAFSRSLVHILRNAIDHGLEPTSLRNKKGKDARGMMRISWQEGSFCLKDDGLGLCLNKIREQAHQRGLLIPEDPLAVANLIFEDGFSTAAQTTSISGRGVGMNAVRSFLKDIGSTIEIVPERLRTEDGHEYMEFHFRIPVPSHLLSPDNDLKHAV